ncbi:MAG: hypothetical protein ABH854_04085 [Candidatus Diapherotrites archaeon]
MDPMYLVNLVLCVVILFLGWMGYKKSKKAVPLYVGIGFALFGVSHLATILGMKESLETVLIVVRTLGYLVVAFALYRLWKG